MANKKKDSLFDEENFRYTIFPIKFPDVWKLYKEQEACRWQSQEIDYSTDFANFEKLSSNEQHFIKFVLAFFASADILVSQNLSERFINDVKMNEAIFFYNLQTAMENVHSETYSLLIEHIIKDNTEKDYLINAMKNIESIRKKTQWIEKCIKSDASYATRLIQMAISEGIFFSSSFCSIFWLQNKFMGQFAGICLANNFIARDEGQHVFFSCFIYKNYITEKLPQKEVHKIFNEALEIESEFVRDALNVDLIGINADLMIQYVRYSCDFLLIQLGYDKLYGDKNPFDFMNKIVLSEKTDFFSNRLSSYQPANVEQGLDGHITVDDDF